MVSTQDHCITFFYLTRATADDEMETNEEVHGPLCTSWARFQRLGTGIDSSLLAIPEPYPTMPPPGQEDTDAYYVVDVGRDVGIFTDKYVVFPPNLITPHSHSQRAFYPRCCWCPRWAPS